MADIRTCLEVVGGYWRLWGAVALTLTLTLTLNLTLNLTLTLTL